MQQPQKQLQEAGFSTIEAIAAVAILMVALWPVYSMLQQLGEGAQRSMQFVEARSIIRSVESIIAADLHPPLEMNGWSVEVQSTQVRPSQPIDGYLGGQYFFADLQSVTITVRNGEYQKSKLLYKVRLNPIFENETEAILSNL